MTESKSSTTKQVATQLAIAAAASAVAYYVGQRSKDAKKKKKAAHAKRSIAAAKSALPVTPENERHRLTSVVVRVPATSANLGPGFDTIGLALDIWTEISVEILPPTKDGKSHLVLTNEGEGADELPTDDTNLVIVGLKAAYGAAGEDLPKNLKIHCKNRIPFARGLGSSSAGIVGGIIAGLALSGMRLPVRGKEELLQFVRIVYSCYNYAWWLGTDLHELFVNVRRLHRLRATRTTSRLRSTAACNSASTRTAAGTRRAYRSPTVCSASSSSPTRLAQRASRARSCPRRWTARTRSSTSAVPRSS